MNSHQRKKLRKKQKKLRQTQGVMHTLEDRQIRDRFLVVARKLFDLKQDADTYWYSVSYKVDPAAYIEEIVRLAADTRRVIEVQLYNGDFSE